MRADLLGTECRQTKFSYLGLAFLWSEVCQVDRRLCSALGLFKLERGTTVSIDVLRPAFSGGANLGSLLRAVSQVSGATLFGHVSSVA